MLQNFEFIDDGRTFACSTEAEGRGSSGRWWWFRVSTDDRHRYAPFRAMEDDNEYSVRTRVVAYYDDLLLRRGLPSHR